MKSENKARRVSVVIPTYNRTTELKECLDSIKRQTYPDIEIIVIDDNSTEHTEAMIKSDYNGVVYHKNRENKYPSFAKNQGILLCAGYYILFVDNDTVLTNPKSIENSVNILEAHSKIAAVGGELFIKNNKPVSVHGVKFEFKDGYVVDKRWHTANKKLKYVDVVDTSNFLIRKSLVLEAGGFDPYYKYPHEDSDLCFRLKGMGHKVAIDFDSGAVHKRSKKSRMVMIYFVSRSRIRYQIKNFGFFKTSFFSCFDRPLSKILLNKILKKETMEEEGIGVGISQIDSDKQKYKYFYYTFYLLKAIAWNLVYFNQTRKSRGRNFLEDEELKNSIKD